MKNSTDLTVLLERLSRVLQNETHAEGLKPAQWEALRFLSRANKFSRTPSGLTAYLGVTKGTVSQTVNALESKGLVAKKTDAADRRQVQINLTTKGRRLLAVDPIEAAMKAGSKLSAAEQRETARTLEALLKGMLRERGGRPFGACRACRYFRANDPQGAPHRCGLLDEPLSKGDSDLICVEQEA
jgi:DNA-binding MarR family transcriptional regulator